jgi:adenylate kinase family enzyme
MSSEPATNVATPQAPAVSTPIEAQGVVTEAPVTKVEAPPVEAKVSKETDDGQFGHKFSILQRREREIQKREAELRERAKEIESDSGYKEYTQAKNAKNPLQALQALGMSYQDATEFVLNNSEATPAQQIKNLQSVIEELKNDLTGYKQSKEDEEYNGTINAAKREIREIVDSSPEQFEFIRANDAYETIWEVIEEHHAQTGKVLPYDQAAKHVEDYIEAQAQKMLSIKKLSSKFGTKVDSKELAPPQPTQASNRQTLTNSMVSAAPNAILSSENRYLSDDESKLAAAEFLRNALRSQNS